MQIEINHQPKINRIISAILGLVFAISSIIFIFKVLTFGLLPAKFFYLLFGVLLILNLLYFFLTLRKKAGKIIRIILGILAILFSVGLFLGGLKIDGLNGFLNKNFNDDKKYAIYNVIISKDSSKKSLNDLVGAELFTFEESLPEVSDADLTSATKTSIKNSSLVFKNDIETVMSRPLKSTSSASVINNGTFESYLAANEGYEAKIKIIGEIKVEVKNVEKPKADASKNLAKKPFLLYISGIDTRTGTMPSRSLSDVNILAAINPATKKILLVNIPRDSYVLVHGDNGLRDKLTHAGSRGGLQLSTATIEDLFGLKIDRNIRVNFNFVTKLVDSIGGITVTNDLNRTLTLEGCTYKPGDNAVDGKCALRFARERKSYDSGDRHRGENQQQIITRIINKISSNKSIILGYEKILSAIDGSFESNLTSENITSLVRLQLDEMSPWQVESYNVNGSGRLTKTHSYPNQNLYVMDIDQTTLFTAKTKLEAVLSN
jgi:integral membrane regulatory protein wzg